MLRLGSRITRRDVLRSATVATTAIASGGVLAACAGSSTAGSSAAQSALPAPTAGDIIINFAPNWQGASWNNTAVQINQEFIDQQYNAKNKGVYVKVAGHVQGGAQTQILDTIAGKGFMDVFQDCCSDLATLEASGVLAPLDNYLRKDNIDTKIWSQSHLAVLQYNGKQMALPAYDGPVTVFYRQDMLDSMGLAYPDSTWTVKDAQTIWERATKTINKNGKATHQYGVMLYNTGYYEQLPWWLHGWGASMMDGAGTKCTADTTNGQACLAFLQQMATSKVAMGRGNEITALQNGDCVFEMAGGWELLPAARQLGTTVKWNILPNPVWPGGRATFDNIDYYCMNQTTKNPDQAWAFLKWVTAESAYQSFQMQATLVQPCLVNLWNQWETLAVAVAPPLKGKDIHWIADAAINGYAIPNRFFKYGASKAVNLIDTWGGQIWSGQVGSAVGLKQMAAQLNQLEATTEAQAGSAATIAKLFPTSNGKPIAAVPTGI